MRLALFEVWAFLVHREIVFLLVSKVLWQPLKSRYANWSNQWGRKGNLLLYILCQTGSVRSCCYNKQPWNHSDSTQNTLCSCYIPRHGFIPMKLTLTNNHAPKDNDLQLLVLPLLCIKHGGGRWLCSSSSLSSKETGKLSPTMNLDEEENRNDSEHTCVYPHARSSLQLKSNSYHHHHPNNQCRYWGLTTCQDLCLSLYVYYVIGFS